VNELAGVGSKMPAVESRQLVLGENEPAGGFAGRVVPGSAISSLWDRNEKGLKTMTYHIYLLSTSIPRRCRCPGFYLLWFVSVVLRVWFRDSVGPASRQLSAISWSGIGDMGAWGS
jgi:hypothetical protein